MKDFLIAQKKKIEIDKWCEGCDKTKDPGQEYVINWIDQNGEWFRQAWEMSLCKSCCSSKQCGYNVLQLCDSYTKLSSVK